MSGTLMAACVFAGIGGAGIVYETFQRRNALQRVDGLRRASGIEEAANKVAFASTGAAFSVLRYCIQLQTKLASGATRPLFGARWKMPDALKQRVQAAIVQAGLAGRLETKTVIEGSVRLGLIGLLGLGLLGSAISSQAMVGLGCIGLFGGASAIVRALRQEAQLRNHQLEKELPEMLEIVGLCLRSGLTFERGLAVYTSHFDTPFSRECASAQRRWELGLKPRDQALRDIAATYSSALLSRAIETIVRSLRFGVPLAEPLAIAAAEARATYKANRREQVAKVPVKMMVPTGALILPAMLLFVLGPVLLDVMG